MVNGIHVIGGFACNLLMNDAGLEFRQTVDIDMVLIIEALQQHIHNRITAVFLFC